jgi:hypothetical protein
MEFFTTVKKRHCHRGGFDAVLFCEPYHPQSQFKLVSVVFHTYNLVIESKWFNEHRRPFAVIVFLLQTTHITQGSF